MKKAYSAPQTVQINITTENMLALSMGIDYQDPTEVSNDGRVDQWSHKKGWSSEDWSGNKEE